MSKSNSVNGVPLSFREVLEQEYVALHGSLPPESKTPKEDPLAVLYRTIHKQKHAALCLSGGGIRSATFALGVIQGLARAGLLRSFDYLSTVSGGGYIGSWLTAWIHHHPDGLDGVSDELAKGAVDRPVLEPAPVRYLRSYTKYLSPKFGMLSADTWTLVAAYLRNLVLNWLVFLPLLMVVLAVPRFCLAMIYQPAPVWLSGPFAMINPAYGMLVGVGFLMALVAIVYSSVNQPCYANKSQLQILGWVVLPLLVAGASFTTFWAWHSRPDSGASSPYTLGELVICGLALHFVGWLGYVVKLPRQFKTKAKLALIGYLFAMLGVGALEGLFAWLVAAKGFPNPSADPAMYVCFAAPAFMTLVLLAGAFFMGFASMITDDQDREWLTRIGAWILIGTLGWSVISVLVIYGPDALVALWRRMPALVVSLGGISGLISILGGKSSATPASNKAATQGRLTGLVLNNGLTVFAAIFGLFVVVLLSLLTSEILQLVLTGLKISPTVDDGACCAFLHRGRMLLAGRWVAFGFMVGMGLMGLFFALFVNINKFSLHGIYRDRLIRAYLGASRGAARYPNLFTGFDPNDNLTMANLGPDMLAASSFRNIGALLTKLKQVDQKLKPSLAEVVSHALAGTAAAWRNFSPLLMNVAGDLENMAKQVGRQADSDAARYVVRRFSRNTRERLRHFDETDLNDVSRPGLEIAVTQELNALLLDKQMERAAPFQGLNKNDAAQLSLIGRNRALLQAAFSNEIKPRPDGAKLFHVVNVALNLVAGKKLAWQERKAETFTVTPLHCGSAALTPDDALPSVPFRGAYRRSGDYGKGGRNQTPISLGTALTISGAAASPNMGYHSSPGIAFLLTLFNVRLGCWLGNPGSAGHRAYMLSSPRYGVLPIFEEAFGLTDDSRPYVYLSDGGHFENLGLYEMVLRRCRHIVVCDAGADPDYTFEDLGNAIRKCRVDFGIRIEIDVSQLRPAGANHLSLAHWAVGKIRYDEVDPGAAHGILLYIKSSLTKGVPSDVQNYATQDPAFPHQSTADQFFTEAQFESYRALGEYIAQTLCQDGSGNFVSDLEKLFA